MKRFIVLLAAVVAATGPLISSHGAAPAKVSEVLIAEDLADEAKDLARKLANTVTSQATFDRSVEQNTINRGAGTIACLAQALAEHKDGEKTGVASIALRNAALTLADTEELDAAKTALDQLNAALEGKGEKGESEHEWSELVAMHSMMQEIELRQVALRRVLRRPRRLPSSSGDATVIAALSLTMEVADYGLEGDDLKKWVDWSKKYRIAMTELANAMKADEADKAQEIFNASGQHCTDCHKEYRD